MGQRGFLAKNWWVFVFSFAALLFYSQAIRTKKQELMHCLARMRAMNEQKQVELLRNEELRVRMHSQNDPAWIEMVLMRDLGVVPEGWLKVHFQK